MKKLLMLAAILTLCGTTQTFAQWRVGATVGADYNVFSIDKQYMNDYKYNGRWGLTLGVSGQYDFFDWFGVRADLNWTQKNHSQCHEHMGTLNVRYTNDYLQLPVMASFSFGGEKLRGFCNLGVYGGYWLSSKVKGTDFNYLSDRFFDISSKVSFDKDRDQRWDCGLVGGVGLEYQVAEHWAVQAELRYYYSTTSTTKQYMCVKDYRYNSTTALQVGAYYIF